MVKEVLDTMVTLAEEGMTMIVVTHEMGFARKVADRVVFMEAGEVIEVKEPGAFFDTPEHDSTKRFLANLSLFGAVCTVVTILLLPLTESAACHRRMVFITHTMMSISKGLMKESKIYM